MVEIFCKKPIAAETADNPPDLPTRIRRHAFPTVQIAQPDAQIMVNDRERLT